MANQRDKNKTWKPRTSNARSGAKSGTLAKSRRLTWNGSATKKAEWQAANPEKNVAYVQAFRERWGRWPAKAEKRDLATTPAPSKKLAAKATKKAAKPKPKARQARRAPGKKARHP